MAIAYPFVDKEYFLIANGEYIEQLKGIGSLQNLHIKKNLVRVCVHDFFHDDNRKCASIRNHHISTSTNMQQS